MRNGDPYSVLGLPPDSSSDDVTSAYRRRAKLLHPDVHHMQSQDMRDEAALAMKQLSAAYSTILASRESEQVVVAEQATAKNRRYSSPPRQPSRETERPPNSDECTLCGSSPVRHVHAERHVGLIVFRRVHDQYVTACRDCGLSLVRSAQDLTLLQGWWGAMSALLNVSTVLRNGFELWRLSRLDEPIQHSAVKGPLVRPLPTGRPVWLRKGFFLTSVIMVAGTVLAVSQLRVVPPAEEITTFAQPNRETPDRASQFPWDALIGGCFSEGPIGRFDSPVGCVSPESQLRVIAVEAFISRCPSGTDSFQEVETLTVLCVEDTQ